MPTPQTPSRRHDDSLPKDPDRAALAWFARLKGPVSSADRAEFDRWMQASPAHRNAWRRVDSLWHAAEGPGVRVAGEEAEALGVYLKAIQAGRERQRRMAKAAGAASLLLIGLIGTGVWLERPHLFENLRADFVSVKGERRLVTLSDGSTVLLDADSALDENFTDDERRVVLLRGAGFFSVVKAQAPFVVEAADGQVRVLGTRFDVRMAEDGAAVTVSEGKVSVMPPAADVEVLLTPGEEVLFGTAGAGEVRTVDIEDVMGWHQGRYVFYKQPLSDVVRQIERYRPGRIVILDPALANRRVSGSFLLDDPEARLDALQSTVGFSMYSIAGRLTLLR